MKKFKVILRDGEDGYFVVECPELPGCISQGKSRAEALQNIKEAIELYLEPCKCHTQPLPHVEFCDVVVGA